MYRPNALILTQVNSRMKMSSNRKARTNTTPETCRIQGLVYDLLFWDKTETAHIMFRWPCIVVYQYIKTNVIHFLLNLLRIMGLYMFRALLAHTQETVHTQHLVYCVRVMSVGCTRDGVEVASLCERAFTQNGVSDVTIYPIWTFLNALYHNAHYPT
jgi:hypothetical protein